MKNTIEETQNCKAIVEQYIADTEGNNDHYFDIRTVKNFLKKVDYNNPVEHAISCMIREEMYLIYCEAMEEIDTESQITLSKLKANAIE